MSDPLRKIVAVAESYRLEWIESLWPAWHGPGKLCGMDAADVAHELAHWLVAPPSRKNVKWHGLGKPGGIDAEGQIVTDKHAEREESLASLLGIFRHLLADLRRLEDQS